MNTSWERQKALSQLGAFDSVHLVSLGIPPQWLLGVECGQPSRVSFLTVRKIVQLFTNKRALSPYLFIIPLHIQWGFLTDDVIHFIIAQIHPLMLQNFTEEITSHEF